MNNAYNKFMDKNICGHRIQAARALHEPKLTQDDLVAKLQVECDIYISRNMLSRMETNQRYVTDLELIAISKVLHVPIAWLLDISENGK